MSNQLEIEDINKEQNYPNIFLELLDKKSNLNEKLTPSKIIEQDEKEVHIFSENQSNIFISNFIFTKNKKYLIYVY